MSDFLDVRYDRKLSLRRLLKNLSKLHHHICTITRIARSRRLSPVFKGRFNVVPIPVFHGNISINFSQENILPIIFPPGNPVEQDIKQAVYDELLKRLQEKAGEEGIYKERDRARTIDESKCSCRMHPTRILSPTPAN